MQIMIDAVINEEPLTLVEMTAQAVNFFLAGSDTTSAAILHVMLFLAKHPKSQQKVYEELKYINNFSYESLNQLKYLNAVIDETLRLKPSTLAFTRVCVKDIQLSGKTSS